MTRSALFLSLLLSGIVLPGCLAMRFVPVGGGVKGETPNCEVIRFPSGSLSLEARLYPARADRPKREGDPHEYPRLPEEYQKSIILHCHGVADNNTSFMASFFSDAGFRVFQFDYRGFGHSDTAPLSNEGFAEDAIAAWRYLRSRPDVDPEKIVVYGHSMGGAYALAIGAAAEREGKPVRAVITANTFSSWRMIANHFIPVIGFAFGGASGPDPVDYARRMRETPVLIVHSNDDTDVPVSHAYRLYQAAAANESPAALFINPDGGHAFSFFGAPLMEEVMVNFAKHYLRSERPLSSRDVLKILREGEKSPAREISKGQDTTHKSREPLGPS